MSRVGGVSLRRTDEHLFGKKIARQIKRAVLDFEMIRSGDKIAVGLSGGKDSAFLLHSLCALRDKHPARFTLEAITVDPTENGRDTSLLGKFAESLGVVHWVVRYPIFEIIEKHGTSSPCSLCANIRRGILASNAVKHGCASLALGHHRDDVIETVFLNLMYEGRFRCFHPNMLMSRTGVRVIRPLVYVSESVIRDEAGRLSFPTINFCCGYESSSMRVYVKAVLRRLSRRAPSLPSNVLHALKNITPDDLWCFRDDLASERR
jgi:tRNA(Ile)-lysidine synthase TilS/MesJ